MTATVKRVITGAAVVGSIAVAVVLLIVTGVLGRRGSGPGGGGVPVAAGLPAPARTATATKESIPRWYETVGTVESRTTANVAARISAAVVSVKVAAGDSVTEGQELILLDDRDLTARKNQAAGALAAAEAGLRESQRALEAAEAQFVQAEASYKRTKKFHEDDVASDADLEAAEAAFRQAEAGVARAKAAIERARSEADRARQSLREADVALGFTRITAPLTGEVARRMVDAGDLAWPGSTLVVIHDRRQLRLRASVREGLWGEVTKGRRVEVSIPSVDKSFTGTVEEVEPAADPRSRSFVVKVPIPAGEELYPGMFGRLRVELGTRPAVLVSGEAIRRIGQLSMVLVRSGDRWVFRYVRVGPEVGDGVEILSGLDGGEEVGL
jgi:multidrug efflux pump subunit AcrA (membrane-fusion protein)